MTIPNFSSTSLVAEQESMTKTPSVYLNIQININYRYNINLYKKNDIKDTIKITT